MAMNVRNSGSAHRGLGEWLLQRLTALYLAGFMLWLLARFALAPPTDYVTWKTWFSAGWIQLAFALFFLSVLLHAWVGMRSVFLDYLKPLWLRFAAHVLLAIGLLALTFWAAQILLVEAAV